MSNYENFVEEIKEIPQLSHTEFHTIGELKSAVCSAYEKFGDAKFYYDTPVVFYETSISFLREKTPEEKSGEERKKDAVYYKWRAMAKKHGFKYE